MKWENIIIRPNKCYTNGYNRGRVGFKKASYRIMLESTKSVVEAIKVISNFITNISQSINNGLAMVASRILQCQQSNHIKAQLFYIKTKFSRIFPLRWTLLLHSCQPLPIQRIILPIWRNSQKSTYLKISIVTSYLDYHYYLFIYSWQNCKTLVKYNWNIIQLIKVNYHCKKSNFLV